MQPGAMGRTLAGLVVTALLVAACSNGDAGSPPPTSTAGGPSAASSEADDATPSEQSTSTAMRELSADAEAMVAALGSAGVCESPEPRELPPPGFGEEGTIVCSGENTSTTVLVYPSADAAAAYVCSPRGESQYAHAAGTIVVELTQTFGADRDTMDRIRSELDIALERPSCEASEDDLDQARADAVADTIAALRNAVGCEPEGEPFLAQVGSVQALVQECTDAEAQRAAVLGFRLPEHADEALVQNAQGCPEGSLVAGLRLDRSIVFVSVNRGDDQGFAATEEDLARLYDLFDVIGGEVDSVPCEPA